MTADYEVGAPPGLKLAGWVSRFSRWVRRSPIEKPTPPNEGGVGHPFLQVYCLQGFHGEGHPPDGCAQAYGSEESISIVLLPSVETLGFLMTSREAGLNRFLS